MDPEVTVDPDIFEFVWGIDNAPRSKAEALAAAVEQLGLPPSRICYIGDTIKDAFSAQHAGLGLFLGANWGGFEDMRAAAAQLNQLYFGHDGPPPPLPPSAADATTGGGGSSSQTGAAQSFIAVCEVEGLEELCYWLLAVL